MTPEEFSQQSNRIMEYQSLHRTVQGIEFALAKLAKANIGVEFCEVGVGSFMSIRSKLLTMDCDEKGDTQRGRVDSDHVDALAFELKKRVRLHLENMLGEYRAKLGEV